MPKNLYENISTIRQPPLRASVEGELATVTVRDEEVEDCDPDHHVSWVEPVTRIYVEASDVDSQEDLAITYHADGCVTIESARDGKDYLWIRKEIQR
jgi:hypothetical protein